MSDIRPVLKFPRIQWQTRVLGLMELRVLQQTQMGLCLFSITMLLFSNNNSQNKNIQFSTTSRD